MEMESILTELKDLLRSTKVQVQLKQDVDVIETTIIGSAYSIEIRRVLGEQRYLAHIVKCGVSMDNFDSTNIRELMLVCLQRIVNLLGGEKEVIEQNLRQLIE